MSDAGHVKQQSVLAVLLLCAAAPAKARAHWQEALAIYRELGAPEAEEARAQLQQLTG